MSGAPFVCEDVESADVLFGFVLSAAVCEPGNVLELALRTLVFVIVDEVPVARNRASDTLTMEPDGKPCAILAVARGAIRVKYDIV